jgi:outer membrane immunogenic protein
MKTLLLSATVLAISSIGAAHAQTAPGWTGFYAGGHVGYGFKSKGPDETTTFDKNLDGAFNDTVTTAAGADAFSPGFCSGRALTGLAASGCDTDDNGVEMGLRLGYDMQMSGGLVIGAVGELTKTNVNDGTSAFSTTPASYTFRRDLDWTAAARVRAGYAIGPYLPYLTGGVLRAKLDRAFSSTNTVNTFIPRDDGKESGYQLGGGLERRVGANFAVGVEYLYSHVSDNDYTVRVQGPAPATNPFILTNPSGTDIRRSGEKFAYHAVRVTAAYRF